MYSIFPSEARRFGKRIAKVVGDVKECAENSYAHHLLFDAGIKSDTAYRLIESDGVGHARLFLRCAEFLELSDPHGIEDLRTTQSFLVLHVMAVDCTSETLEAVSWGMHRPRNKVRVVAGKSTDKINPLSVFTEVALNSLRAAGLRDRLDGVRLTRGGYLDSQFQYPAPSGRSGPSRPRPTRIVMALPGDTVSDQPSLIPGAAPLGTTQGIVAPNSGFDRRWTNEEAWAWSLSSGADQYIETLPRQTDDFARRAECGRYERWAVWAGAFGLAVVRRDVNLDDDPVRIGQTTLMQLAQTRYIDIAILTMRQFTVLAQLTHDLALIESNGRLDSESIDDAAFESLSKRLTALESIQGSLVRFRESLWVRTIPRHETDSLVLQSLSDLCGVERLHNDLLEDISFRRDVYSTQYTSRQMERDRRRVERDRELEQAQKSERLDHERDREEQSRHRDQITMILTVIALALTVPALVESFGYWSEPGAGFLTLGVTIVVAVLAYLTVPRLARRQRSRSHE
ncbi:MAG: hypothetical protein Q4G34_09660 [Micrococcus sp.]|nr:hypothetical protein [Micrococcus sp.]